MLVICKDIKVILTLHTRLGSESHGFINQNNFNSGRILHELDHSRSAITTQQPSATQGILRSSSENLPNLGQHQHPPHPHALNLGMPTQIGHVRNSFTLHNITQSLINFYREKI